MRYSDCQWWMGLISGLCLLVLLPSCKDEEIVSEPASEAEVVGMKTMDPAGLCPQTRGMTNILPASKENLAAGKQLFHQGVQPVPCETCHGFKGDGFGVIFARMQPYPRDFTCYQTMKEISDGQMFWIIKHGSHGTRMKLFKQLEENEIWKLVHYVRHFAEK
jgi:hypothetical protein